MKPIEFPEQTVVIAKNHLVYEPLPVYQFKDDKRGEIVCCWKMTLLERWIVMLNGKIWQSILTFNGPVQPLFLSVKKPELPLPGGSGK